MRRALLLTVAIVALWTPSAAAAWTPPGDRPATTPLVSRFVGIAETFWQDRNVPTCPANRLDVRLGDDLSDGLPWEHAYGRAQMSGCTIWLLAGFVQRAESSRPGSDRVIYLCRVITHELGHTGGLPDDTSGGVMDPGGEFYTATPFACRAWAARATHRRLTAGRRARGASSRPVPAEHP